MTQPRGILPNGSTAASALQAAWEAGAWPGAVSGRQPGALQLCTSTQHVPQSVAGQIVLLVWFAKRQRCKHRNAQKETDPCSEFGCCFFGLFVYWLWGGGKRNTSSLIRCLGSGTQDFSRHGPVVKWQTAGPKPQL